MILNVVKEIVDYVGLRIALLILCGERKNNFLRRMGIKIGKGCKIYASDFSTEPFLIEIGNHVTIAPGTVFITHDGAVEVMRDIDPEMDIFGKIIIGDNSVIGSLSIILPNTEIGENCIVGAGSVVRGKIPDNSVVIGNPGKVVMKTPLVKIMYQNHKHCLKTKLLKRKAKMKMVREHFNA